ncbi:hypothetical protein P691DRAFT_704052 [Macrolepiota fuliginosa MF-IS2]|uniref:DUF6593 domain-containing protein n=1 Tax=Macrolepiota fuliginosa MF-IS2 TaxID=1400762 RepID=A0A9P6C4M5_9AGAR|nr:hypothetical protein P691DRAFT_704052 [Macrolepiota fuliginosa MF-IS2]
MPESVHSTTTTQIPRIPEPVVLTWTPDYDDGDVAYIAGSPPPPIPPPPSLASSSSTSVDTVRGHPLPPPPPPPPSLASERSSLGQFWASAVSLAHATIGEGSNSRRVSLIDEETALDAIMEETSPEYIEARVPTYTLEYTFSPVEGEGESMLVVPPLDAPDTRPVYHIKVTHDLFDPSFFITTVRRGGGSDGDVIGDFMMKAGCSALEETVFFKKSECHIFKKLVAITKKDEFQWRLHDSNDGSLLWKWDKQWTCRHVPERNVTKNKNYELLAQFHPPSAMRTPANTAKAARMTVYPPGQKFFDEIVMSVLILERKRRKLMGTRRVG